MATVNAALLTKSDSKGRHIIALRIEANNRRTYSSLRFKIRKSQWNPQAQRVRGKSKVARDHNDLILKKLAEANETLRQLRLRDVPITVETIKEALQQGNKFLDFWPWAWRWLEHKRDIGQIHYWRRCRAVLRKFSLSAPSPLLWSQFSVHVLDDFDTYLQKKGNSSNTRIIAFRVLRTLINEAVRKSIISSSHNPFIRFEAIDSNSIRREKLTIEELRRLESLDLKSGSMDALARDMYILAVRLRGMRFGDCIRLTWDSVHSDRIEYVMGKNREKVVIPMVPEVETLLGIYRTEFASLQYVFPPLNKRTYSTTEDEVAVVSSINALINRSLKRIAIKAEIDKSVSFHTARHSFATLAMYAGVDNHIIQAALKHKKSATTDKYLKTLDDRVVDDSLKKIAF